MTYKNHTIEPVRDSSGLSVRISGPEINSRAGTFPTGRAAIKYAKKRIDEALK